MGRTRFRVIPIRLASLLLLLGGGTLVISAAGQATAGSAGVVAHRAEARSAPARLHPKVQLIHTSITSFEPTIGFDRAGGAWFFGHNTSGTVELSLSGLYRMAPDGSRIQDRTAKVQGQPIEQTEDPYVYSDPRTGRVFDVELQLPCSIVRYTDDLGASWKTSLAGCTLADHQSVFAGPAPAGGAKPTGYPNVVYYCAITDGALSLTSAGVGCERSLDGGATWINTGGQPFIFDTQRCARYIWVYAAGCDGVSGQGVVAPDGTVLVPKGVNGVPMLARSRDEGATWERVVVSGLGSSTDFNGISDGQSSVAVDSSGAVYYAWMGKDRQPRLAVSRDGGRHFGAARAIGIPGLHQAWHVAIDAAGRGRVAVHYIGSEDAPTAPFPDDSTCRRPELIDDAYQGTVCEYTPTADYARSTWNAYLGITADALSANPTWYSARTNPAGDPLVVGSCLSLRCQQEYDFTDVHISPYDGSAWAVYIDGCNRERRCTGLGNAQLARMKGVDLRK